MNTNKISWQSRFFLTCGAGVIGAVLAASAQAQFVNQNAARWYVNGAVATGAYNPWWGGGYGGTTAAESYQRGMADVIRAQGEYNVQEAQAAEEYEKARSRYIDNQTKWLAEYNQRKRMGEAQRSEEQQQRRDYIDRGRSARAAARAGSQSQELPVPAQVDPETGEIAWPAALQEQRYLASTQNLDALVRQWAEGRDATLLAPQVEELADQLQEQLHANIGEYAANDFIAADKLLTSLRQLAASAG